MPGDRPHRPGRGGRHRRRPDSGAVDYVTKPFRLAELQARIAAHLRQAARATRVDRRAPIAVGDLDVDRAPAGSRWRAPRSTCGPRSSTSWPGSPRTPARVVRREDLMSDVWDEHWWGSTKTLDVHIDAVRRKLGEEPGRTEPITAVRGVGYRLEVD